MALYVSLANVTKEASFQSSIRNQHFQGMMKVKLGTWIDLGPILALHNSYISISIYVVFPDEF